MRPVRPNPPASAVALIVMLLTLSGCAGESADTVEPPPVTATELIVMQPFAPGGAPAPGITVVGEASAECHPSGVDAGNPRARRCLTKETSVALDPCFLPTPEPSRVALCLPDPTSGRATKVTIVEHIAAEPGAVAGTDPWVVELANGTRCGVAGGVPATLDGLPLRYGCDDHGFLYGSPDVGRPVWTVHYQPHGAPSTEVAAIRTAWS